MTPQDIGRVQNYLRTIFSNNRIVLKKQKLDDAAEVYIADEFVGMVYRDDEEGELSFSFNMAILGEDLPNI